MNEVEKKFMDKAANHNSIILYSKNDTLKFIAECYKLKIRILGIDGFFITKTTTQPSMEDSIDFSSISYIGKNIYDDAIDFINTRKEDLYFEIVTS